MQIVSMRGRPAMMLRGPARLPVRIAQPAGYHRPFSFAGIASSLLRQPAGMPRPLAGDSPVTWLGEFHGTDDTIALMLQYARGPEGEQNPKVRQYAEAIVRQLRPKDYLGEICAIRHWCTAPHLRYANDARHVEQVKSPFRVLTEIEQYGVSNLDCDDYATLISALGMCLGREARFTMVGFGVPGDYTHVFACLKEPRSSQWIITDPVAGTREHQMASTAKTYKHISVDE